MAAPSAPTMARRIARRITRTSVAAIVAAALFLLIVRLVAGPLPLLSARATMFTTFGDRAAFEAPPERLLAAGFRTDEERALRRWRDTLDAHPLLAGSLDTVAAIPAVVPRAEALIRLYSNWGTEGNGCGLLPRLADKIRDTGCCSDHTEVFLALAPAVDLFARESMFGEHGVVEVWDPDARAWAMLDPMLGERWEDAGGRTLSLLALRDAMLDGPAPLRRVFRPRELSELTARETATLYDPPQFRWMAMTFGSNVVAEDALRARLRAAPKAVARLVGYALGVTPRYVALDDARTAAANHRQRLARDVTWGVLVLLALGALAQPAAWALARARA